MQSIANLHPFESGVQFFAEKINELQLPQIDFNKCRKEVEAAVSTVWSWRDHAISKIDDWDKRLDVLMPNSPIQTRIDSLIEEIESIFEPLVEFNDWLNSNGHGAWHEQLAQFLVKLPFRAARNIVQQLYTVIKGIVFGVVHPLKAVNMVAKFLVLLPYELVKPETWSAMGAGILGASCGEAVIMGGFGSPIGVGIGGALLLGGVSVGTLKVMFEAAEEERLEKAGQYLVQQGQRLSEVFLTSFYTGIIIAAIRKVLAPEEKGAKAELQKREKSEQVNSGRARQSASKTLQEPMAPDFYEVVELCKKKPEGYPPIAYAVKLNRPDVVKFFLEHGESIHGRTPHMENWAYLHENSFEMKNFGNTEGCTALELAIKQQNVEMVELLTMHNADPLLARKIITLDHSYYHPQTVVSYSTPLSEAIAVGNKEIVEVLLKSCKMPESFFSTFGQVQAMQQADIMQTWIEQYALLRTGVSTPISQEVVKTLMTGSLQEAVLNGNVSIVKQVLDSGWVLSGAEVKTMLLSNNRDILALLSNHAYLQNGVNPMMMAVDLGMVEAIKASFQQGLSIDGVLLHAVKEGQKGILPSLLELPFGKEEIAQAINQAYQMGAYDVMELLEMKVATVS